MNPMMSTIPLREIAHARAGDKGNTSNISVIAYDPAWYETIVEQVTEEAVGLLFAARRPTRIRRYELPRLHALNFVLEGVLDGGVNSSLNLDAHGKSLAFLLLGLGVRILSPSTPLPDAPMNPFPWRTSP
ncbi:hypothetical protein [Pelomonas sp. KK5]|uniref:AtuA-related protein n=1 Tax=Pelomonas sp. KK5 TaxID=1855730 RepID=UPI00097BD237|nr:hypothetical protein [Pelomonas sp. KK5]